MLHESADMPQGAVIPDADKNYVPELPSDEEGYVFEGWYFDKGCTQEYEFTTMPLDGIVVEDEGGSRGEMEALFRRVEASVEKELSEIQKEIIRMHEYEGMTFEDIANELGMTPAAVRMQASRARKILREKYREEYEKD